MIATSDITIIGSGIIGLLTAKTLVNAGATVTILEKNLMSQESSWAGGGILLPLYPWRQSPAISYLVIQSLKLYPKLVQDLTTNTPINPEWRSCGLLITKNPDVLEAINWCINNAIPYEQANHNLLNNLNTQPHQPLWLPTIGQIRNPRLLKALKYDLLSQGVTLHEQCTITDVTIKQDRITDIKTNLGNSPIKQLVIAAGAWSQAVFSQFFAQFSQHLPQITPVKGQMLLYQAQPNTLPHIVLDDEHYLIPRYDGKIIVGSTVESQGFDKATTEEAKQKLQTFALKILPELANYPLLHHWAGLRPGTSNGVPYISQHPCLENLWLNAGHFRNGLVMAPASAQLLVDLILNRPTTLNPQPYKLN